MPKLSAPCTRVRLKYTTKLHESAEPATAPRWRRHESLRRTLVPWRCVSPAVHSGAVFTTHEVIMCYIMFSGPDKTGHPRVPGLPGWAAGPTNMQMLVIQLWRVPCQPIWETTLSLHRLYTGRDSRLPRCHLWVPHHFQLAGVSGPGTGWCWC